MPATGSSPLLINPPIRLMRPIQFPDQLQLDPGPSNMSDPTRGLGHLDDKFFEIMDDVKAGLQYVFQTENALTFAVPGTERAGMECAMVNLLEPHDTLLILQNGVWGRRAVNFTKRMKVDVKLLQVPEGQVIDIKDFVEAVRMYKPAVVFLCHGESSTGVLHPLDGLGEVCRNNGVLLLVDTSTSLSTAPFHAEALKVDCVYSASNWVFDCPPGLAPISFNDRSLAKIRSRKTPVPLFYYDALKFGNYWGCFSNEDRSYHNSAPTSILYALRESLAMVAREGIQNVVNRHLANAAQLQDALESLDLELFVNNPKHRLPCLTTVKVPSGIHWKAVQTDLMAQGIEIAGVLGGTIIGEIWRIGTFGVNSDPAVIGQLITALRNVLLKHGHQFKNPNSAYVVKDEEEPLQQNVDPSAIYPYVLNKAEDETGTDDHRNHAETELNTIPTVTPPQNEENVQDVAPHSSRAKKSKIKKKKVKKLHKCYKCAYTSKFKSSVKIHMRIHSGQKNFKCDVCSYASTRSDALRRHMCTHTNERPHKCDQCPYAAITNNHLKVHKRIHTGERPYKCPHCTYASSRSHVLRIHMLSHTGEKPHKCQLCNYACVNSGNLIVHMRKHTGEKPHKCSYCAFESATSVNLKLHILTHTGEKPFKCNLCSYASTQKGNLQNHMFIHSGEKPFKCDYCSYASAQKSNVEIHMFTHTGEKPHKCHLCAFAGANSGNLKLHMRTHTGEKPFTCDLCSYAATQMRDLRNHMYNHTGETPFLCNLCPYGGIQKWNFVAHMRTHTGEKPYQCEPVPICFRQAQQTEGSFSL
ncbi:zinc-finger double domain-containing protein [Ditylenchus destructor]|nr:zinc-finger double domain-containing protein [Ditylenchus destructor]